MATSDVRIATRVKVEDQYQLLESRVAEITTSETIASAFGSALPAGTELVRLGAQTADEVVNFNPARTATAANASLPQNGALLDVVGDAITTGELFADTKNCNIWCYGRID